MTTIQELKAQLASKTQEIDSERFKWTAQLDAMTLDLRRTKKIASEKEKNFFSNDNKSRTLEIESRRIQEVLSKVLGYMRGTPGEKIVDSMIACA